MPFLETKAHLQSFETKMEFIQPKLTEIWPFEIWIFKKQIEKIEKLIDVKGLINDGKHANFP